MTPTTNRPPDRPTVAQLRPGDLLQLSFDPGQLVLVVEIRPTDDGLLTLRLTPGPGRRSWTTEPMRPTAQLPAAVTRPMAADGQAAR